MNEFAGGLLCIGAFLVAWLATRGMTGAWRGSAFVAAAVLIIGGLAGSESVEGKAALPWLVAVGIGGGIAAGAYRSSMRGAASEQARAYGLEPGPEDSLGRDGAALLWLERGDHGARLTIEARCAAVGAAVLSKRGRIALPVRATFWSAASPVTGWDGWTLYAGSGEPFRVLPKVASAPGVLSLIGGNLRASWQGTRHSFDAERVLECRTAFAQCLAALGGPAR